MRAMKEILTFPSSSGKGSGFILLTIPCLFRKYILLKSFFTLKQRRILSLHKNKPLFLKPNLEAIKKCVAVRLGVIYDSQSTNTKQGGLPVKGPLPHAALQLVAWESYMTLSQPQYTKTPPKKMDLVLLFD
jgi:hypothetical protein